MVTIIRGIAQRATANRALLISFGILLIALAILLYCGTKFDLIPYESWLDVSVNYLILSGGLIGSLIAVRGVTYREVAGQVWYKNITQLGWVAITVLLCTFSLGTVKEVRAIVSQREAESRFGLRLNSALKTQGERLTIYFAGENTRLREALDDAVAKFERLKVQSDSLLRFDISNMTEAQKIEYRAQLTALNSNLAEGSQSLRTEITRGTELSSLAFVRFDSMLATLTDPAEGVVARVGTLESNLEQSLDSTFKQYQNSFSSTISTSEQRLQGEIQTNRNGLLDTIRGRTDMIQDLLAAAVRRDSSRFESLEKRLSDLETRSAQNGDTAREPVRSGN